MVIPGVFDETMNAADAGVGMSQVTFKSDGTFTSITEDGTENGRYTYSNNQLDMGDGTIYTVSVSGKTAVIQWTETEDGLTATFYMTLKKS